MWLGCSKRFHLLLGLWLPDHDHVDERSEECCQGEPDEESPGEEHWQHHDGLHGLGLEVGGVKVGRVAILVVLENVEKHFLN